MARLNIGISFSGGGYRAATFHLGILSFLNTIHVSEGKTLLDCVSVMSTVSGATITGLKYMLALAQKQDINVMARELFADEGFQQNQGEGISKCSIKRKGILNDSVSAIFIRRIGYLQRRNWKNFTLDDDI